MRDKRRNNAGFTLMEAMVAVAIIGVLAALAFVGVFAYQRSLEQLELDATAKELFVAAQNHLTAAKGMGLLDQTKEKKKDEDPDEYEYLPGIKDALDGGVDKDVYHFVVPGATYNGTVLGLMLPFGSIDQTVLGGSYIIQYQHGTGQVINVFYAKTEGRFACDLSQKGYADVLALAGADKAATRKDWNGAVVGWYGADAGDLQKGDTIPAPKLEVTNAERLTVSVTNPGDFTKGSGYVCQLKLVVTGKQSGAKRSFKLTVPDGDAYKKPSYAETYFLPEGVGDKVFSGIVFDDVTSANKHFAQMFDVARTSTYEDNNGIAFVPGENLAIEAIAYDNNKLTNVASSGTKTTNSLFASVRVNEPEEGVEGRTETARVANIRHLENLDPVVSGIATDYVVVKDDERVNRQRTLTSAEQISDMDWQGFVNATKDSKNKIAIYDIEGNMLPTQHADDADNSYYHPVSFGRSATDPSAYALSTTFSYDGQGHTISKVKAQAEGSVGLFTELPSVASVCNLDLVDFEVTATKSQPATESVAGALAGKVNAGPSDRTNIENVLVRASKTPTTAKVAAVDAAGGLVGYAAGAPDSSADTLKIKGCIAAVPVEATADSSSTAGGLVGHADGNNVSITDCAVGGIMKKDGEEWTFDGTSNVKSAAAAGGVLGSGEGTAISYAYATCSVQGKVAAGSIVGALQAGSIRHCYADSYVKGAEENKNTYLGAFAGSVSQGDKGTSLEDNRYLQILNGTNKDDPKALGNGDNDQITAADKNISTYKALWGAQKDDAVSYATTLGADYPYLTVKELHAEAEGMWVATHYGDWPAPETRVVNVKTTSAASSGGQLHTGYVAAHVSDAPAKTRWTIARTASRAEKIDAAAAAANGKGIANMVWTSWLARLRSEAQQPITNAGQHATENQAGNNARGEESGDAQDEGDPQSASDDPAAGEADANASTNNEQASPVQQQEPLPTDGQAPSQGNEQGTETGEAVPEEAAEPAQPKVLHADITSADGKRYTVRVTYDDAASIPDGAQLVVTELNQQSTDLNDEDKQEQYRNRPLATERFVSEEDMAQRVQSLTRVLELGDDDKLMWTKQLEVALVANGEPVTPAADVTVEVETNALPATQSDTLEAVLLDGDESVRLEVSNTTGMAEGEQGKSADELDSRISFRTSRLGNLALAQVAQKKFGWLMHGSSITVFGARSVKTTPFEVPLDFGLSEGRRLVEVFGLNVEPTHPFATTLWISAAKAADDDQSYETMEGYRLDDGDPELLFGEGEAVEPTTFKANDLVALVWDSGYRESVLHDGDVTIVGELPKGTTAIAEDVTDQYRDASSLVEGSGQAVAAAYDLAMLDGKGEAYAFDAEHPVMVTVASLPQDAVDVAVLHVPGEGDARQVPSAQNEDGTVSFVAEGTGTYVVTYTKDAYYRDSEGETWKISATYTADAGIPSDAELVVRELKEGDAGYDEYVAAAAEKLGENVDDLALARPFDINLKNPQTGEEYQPTKDVEVSIQLLNDDLNSYEDISVLHFPGEADGEAEIMDTTVNGETVEFKTDGFSVYVVTGAGAVPRCTYTFYVQNADANNQYTAYYFTDDQGHSLTQQTVKSGNELVVPQLTSSDTEVFAGWYAGTSNGDGGITLEESPYDFDNITITENSAVDLYAVYKHYANVVFHDQYDSSSGTFPVAFTRRTELVTSTEVESTIVRIDDLSVTYTSTDGTNMAFLGWSETPITTPGAATDDNGNAVTEVATDSEGCITVTGETHLYPIFKEIHWLTYYAVQSGSGADYVAPARYFEGDTVPVPLPTTAMDGYTFLGWWTGTLSAEGNNETVNYGSQITHSDGSLVASADDGGVYINGGKLYLRSDVTLFAKWEAQSAADYRIVIHTQSPSDADDLADADKTYVYRESVQLSGTIGDTVSVRDEDKAKAYQGYTYARCDDPKAVAADGSTVLNVYYDKSSEYTPSGSFTLTFEDSATEDASTELPIVYPGIPYGESIAERIPANPSRRGYVFTKWYLDSACTVEANLSTMPDHDLTVYAGWKTGWYVVTIDPNHGALYAEEDGVGTGATWFWSSYEGEPVGEYRHVTRDYVESSAGTWYYVNHSGDGKGGDNGWADRHTYYSQDPSKATEDTTFEHSPGTYTYAGWYEVHEDGTETPYTFGEHTDHNMTLRLHWKKAGTYYLAYAAGDGTLDDGSTKDLLLPENYADLAEITLSKSAIAPEGKTFVGWQVRGSNSTVLYTPGQTFTLHAEDAQRVSGKDVVYLDAVYVRVGTASITYHANGGTVADAADFDFGSTYDSQNQAIAANGSIDMDAGTATVSGLTNNSKFKLSSGTNFTKAGFTLAGWSNKATYDPNDEDAKLYTLGGDYGVDRQEPTTLYAVWKTTVTYYLNEANASWGGTEEGGLWGAPYTYDSTENAHMLDVYLGNSVSEPPYIPAYTGTDSRLFRYWATRSGSGTTEDPFTYTQYDFSQPVTGSLELHAVWSEPSLVTVHAVDASNEALAEKATTDDGWTVSNITANTTETALDATSHVSAPAGYTFAFAAVSTDLHSVSENNAVTAVKYDSAKKSVCVRYAGASDFTELEDGAAIWFVYYQEKTLTIGYKSMESSGVLSDVTSTGATQTSAALGSYTMADQFSAPLSLVTESAYTHYAFAIGSQDTHNDPQMSAANLSLLTDAVGAGDAVPVLRVRNTWRGFEYTTESDDNASWVSCGYDPYLYVIYYAQQPTTVIFREETVGTNAVMNTEFEFDVKVEQTVTDGETVTTSSLFDTTEVGASPYILKTGEERSAIVFYSAPEDGSTTTQTITITQKENTDFTTSVSSDSGTATQRNKWTYTLSGESATQTVTFTNAHTSLPVEVHVALAENNGTEGGIIRRDNLRSETDTFFRFDLPLGESRTLLTELPSASVFRGDANTYAFGAALYGSGASSNGEAVTVGAMGVVRVAYERRDGNIYELVLKDGAGNTLDELGGNDLYYLYYPMLRIKYVKEGADGTLTDITGCLMNGATGSIEESDSVTYSHATLKMNGMTVGQNQGLEIPLSGLTISQGGQGLSNLIYESAISLSADTFRIPPILDDGLHERYLGYMKLGAGDAGITSIGGLGSSVSTSLTMRLKVQNNTLQYSFDGIVWQDLPVSGTPTVYAIYTERGYDFQLSKTVDTSSSGKNAIFTDSTYTVTISSLAITKDSYKADGADSATVAATPAVGETPGTITLAVQDGTRIRVKALAHGDYTVTESGNENYTLTAKKGPIVGGASSAVDVTDNMAISLTLDGETKLDLTNSPKAICKIGDHYFYTLRSMVDYVDTEMASKTATVEMLTDYLMPAADTVEIPGDFNLTIETAEEGFSGAGSLAVITRTDELADAPLFTSNGIVTFKNMVLDGNNVEGNAPLIRSAGDLTIDAGATIQNVINSSSGEGAVFGGAINATAGSVMVNGTISGCSASNGGAIYYTGNGAISLSGQGKIKNNVATTGDGGAIYMTGGTLALSGMSSMSGNKAEGGSGGAVYAASALITVDQKAQLSNNTAKAGGAVYVETGTITVSKTEGYDPPAITGNTATTGDGGAFWVGTGSVRVSGGSVSNNKAESGNGGAIYADSASVAVSDTAELNSNTAQSGGAIYAHTGAVTVSGGALENNTATTGNGGAVCAQSGTVALSGPVGLTGNHAASGNGGAVCAESIETTLNQAAQITGNEAGSGGAIYASSGTITLSASTVDGAEASPVVTGNKAKTGNGGAIWLGSGSITVSGGSLSNNEAKSSGGAVYTEGASFTLTSAGSFTAPTVRGNKAIDGSGGAIYSDSGMITISAGTIGGTGSGEGNTAGANGGVFYTGSGAVTVGTVTMSGNSATGSGGAAYVGSGTAELSDTTMTGNTAANGAAVFVDAGRASFSAGSYTNNVAMAGGAVGMGSTDARLTFSGDVQVKDNKLGTADDAPKSNVYLDQDSSDVLNFAGLGSSASIGIYVPDTLTEQRDVPGARFGSYTDNANVNKITNDRYSSLTVQSDTSAKKLYWGNAIKVSVCYMSSFSGGFPPSSDTDSIRYYKTDSYYPEFNDAAISELAAELFTKYGSNYKRNNVSMSATAVYAGAYLDGDSQFGDYLTKLTWDTATSQWLVTRRDGSTTPLLHSGGLQLHRIYIYYAEPAYINIENNTNMALSISDMKVNDTSVINSDTVAGYGMVFAKNGAIRSALLPVSVSDLSLAANQAVTLLIPGGRNMNYTLEGSFATDTHASIRIRRGTSNNPDEKTLNLDSTGSFESLTDNSVDPPTTEQLDPPHTLKGTTLSGSGTYQIIFGDNKVICKVVDASGVDHPYGKISDALTAIKNGSVTLATTKTAVIEMVTDYLLPASDKVEIPRGYDITLTTATTGTYKYAPVDPDEPRATISRDSENTDSMIDAWNVNGADTVKAKDNTVLRINDLVFDGKSVRGSSDGGGVKSKFVNVYIDNVDFKNVYASNGGAMLIMFSAKDKNNKATVPGTVLEVKNSRFVGCTSTTTETSNRLGGGAIVTNAETMMLEDCTFDTCTAVDQAGAVFHRVDNNYNSWTNISGCTFTNCRANAAGGLELNSKNITVTGTTFEHCIALQRNGGGFNVWALNVSSGNPNMDCWVTVTGCTFSDCHVTGKYNNNAGHGGGFRSNARYTTIQDCTFTNCSTTRHGGGACISNTTAYECNIYGSTFDNCSASEQGGGIFSRATTTTISDYTYDAGVVPANPSIGVYIRDSENQITGRHTEVKNCTAVNKGGAICQDRDGSFNLTNAVVTGSTVTSTSSGSGIGGGVHTLAKTATITGGSISNNTAKNQGGGLYTTAATSLTITGATISGNTSTNSDGGGVYYAPATDTVPLTINSCTMANNAAANGNGGGIWTSAGPVTIGRADGYASGTVMSGCTAKNGGGVYQNKNTSNASLTLTDATVTNCRATNGVGGGIRTNAWTVTLNGATVSHNSATSNGGGLWYDGANDTNRNLMTLSVNGSTVDGNTSGGDGGGIYTLVKSVTVSSPYTVTVGEETVNKAVSISNNTAASNGGGIYHNRNAEDSVLTVTGTEAYPVTISGNQANGTGSNGLGGGVYANVRSMCFTWAEISGNKANGSGGGVCDPMDGATYSLTLDHTSVTGNTSGNQGGGIYTKTQLYLKNDSMVTGNRLTGSTVDNAAGVYLLNNRTLYVGSEGATKADSSSVKENYVASGAASNLRLWWDTTNKQNAVGSVWVYCDLNGYIGVVNAAKVGTQFGTSAIASPAGFSDDSPVFKADTSTLHGIIDRTDITGTKIIWAGPPVAKITDGNGNLLYLKSGIDGEGNAVGTSPAIFDRLYEGDENIASIVGAFNVLNSNNLGLNPGDSSFDGSKPMLYNADGTPYIGTDFCVKMLVETFTSDNLIYIKDVEGRTVTFTTAGTTDSLYPSEAKRATVKAGNISRSFLSPRGSLMLKNIVIDGSDKVRPMWYEPKVNSTVTLGESAIIQNGKAENGGGVYIKQGSTATFEIKGGVIRSCASTNGKDGGAVYLYSGTLNFEAGNITDCTAAGSGGGVFQNTGTFNMTGGTISGCSAKKGGGVLVPNTSNAPFNMSGGSIVNNTATQTGGGIAVNGENARIYFSKKVTISGNKATKDGVQVACNVELDRDSNLVINTNNGGLYGGSYIGVYVPGKRVDDNKDNSANGDPFRSHGTERAPFGTFAKDDSTTNLYSFVNDRNGFKGGIIENPEPNTTYIYWIKIFSLQVSKTVKAGGSTSLDPDEPFLFKVNVRGTPTVSGQPWPEQIDSSTGSYGGMEFTSNGIDTTTAVFALTDGESVTGVNLSEGLDYEIIEYLIVSGGENYPYNNQHIRYAALPMNGYSGTTESLEYGGTTYTVIKANTYSSSIGENKNRTDVDPYTSAVPFTNLMPVCKITDKSGNQLYWRYTWEKTTNKSDEPAYYYAPAVYTELTGSNGAFKSLEGTLYSSNDSNAPSYSVDNGVQIQMLIGNYGQTEGITLPSTVNGEVTLKTASAEDELFPKQDAGTISTIKRSNFTDASMFAVGGKLTLESIILDGAKGTHTATVDGGIANVPSGGRLTIGSKATLQNSKTGANGGAVYVSNGGTVTMTGGTVNKNESVGDGAGIYLEEESTMNLSGSPSFGGNGLDVAGNITTANGNANGNWKDATLTGKLNGGKQYDKPRQDIFIAGYASADDEDTSANSLIITDNITSGDGTIWVWAAELPRYKSLCQFAQYEADVTDTKTTFAAFRNARPDDETGADELEHYLCGITKANDTKSVFWDGLSGFDVKFKKIDGYGNALAGAVFSLYTDSACTETALLEVSGTAVMGTADDGGVVVFNNKIPNGIYYMKETTIPAGYSNDGTYIVLVGDKALAKEGLSTEEATCLGDISTDAITGQTSLYKEAFKDASSDYDKYALFLIDDATGKAVTTPDIAKYGVMNTLSAERKVILQKVAKGTYDSLSGAQFEILRYDRTKVSSTDINGNTVTTFTSDESGVYFVDTLPYGTYYLHEIKIPDGYQTTTAGDDGNWFILTVNEDGAGYKPEQDPDSSEIRNTLNPEPTKPE